MLNTQQKNVISEIFNIGFSKSISRLSILLDDRLDISVPSVINIKDLNLDDIFNESNLIFNDIKGLLNEVSGKLPGSYSFLVEYNDNFAELIESLDIESINQVFLDTLSLTFDAMLDFKLELIDTKHIDKLDDFINYIKNFALKDNYNTLVFSRWTTRQSMLSGYLFLLINMDKFVLLPKFQDLCGIS